jgi:hypothetical protein
VLDPATGGNFAWARYEAHASSSQEMIGQSRGRRWTHVEPMVLKVRRAICRDSEVPLTEGCPTHVAMIMAKNGSLGSLVCEVQARPDG